MEDTRTPHWGRIFNRLLDLCHEIDPNLSIEDLDITFLAWKFQSMFVAWSSLYKGDLHATKTQEEFTRINEDLLQFDPAEWQLHHNRMSKSRIPPQKVPPPKEDAEDRPLKRRPDTSSRDQQPGSGRKKAKTKTKPAVAVTPPPAGASTSANTAVPKKPNPQDICVRDLFHKGDANMFPGTCKPGCQRKHNPQLRNGKLAPGDKAAVKASLDAMTGKFADLALQELDRLF
jgi:hypothetical protein